MIPGTKPLHGSCWRHHRYIAARFWGEVRQIPRDQTVSAASQGHPKERFIVGVRKACGERLWSGGLAGRTEWREEPRDELAGVEHYPQRVRALRTAAISASISSWDSASVPRATERRCIAATASTARA